MGAQCRAKRQTEGETDLKTMTKAELLMTNEAKRTARTQADGEAGSAALTLRATDAG